MEEVVMEEDRVDTFKISKTTRLLKIQVVAKEEEIKALEGAQEEEVDGNNNKIVIQIMLARYVAKIWKFCK